MLLELLIFFSLLICAFTVDFKPLQLNQARKNQIKVTFRGAVKEEKEVYVKPYTTFAEAIESISLAEDADLECFNPDIILNDCDIITIPNQNEADEIKRININTASLNELTNLPGVGKKTAQAIIHHRESVSLFQTPEDIMQVKGIGPNKFEKMKDWITI